MNRDSHAKTVDHLIGGATFIEAVKLAKKMEPESAEVKKIEANGVPNCIRLKPDTPSFVVAWCKKPHNSYHKGTAATLPEMFDQVFIIEAKWRDYTLQNRITHASCPDKGEFTYRSVYRKFVGEQIKKLDASGTDWFTNVHHFTAAKTVALKLQGLGTSSGLRDALSELKDWWDTVCDYSDADFKKDKICHTMAEAINLITDNFARYWPEHTCKMLIIQLLKFCTPQMVDDKDDAASNWIFRTPCQVQSLMTRLLYPIKRGQQASPYKHSQDRPALKRRKTTDFSSSDSEQFAPQPAADDGLREWLWGDELELCIRNLKTSFLTSNDAGYEKSAEDAISEQLQDVLSMSFRYCFLHEIPKSVELKKNDWKQLWAVLKIKVLQKNGHLVAAGRWQLEGCHTFQRASDILDHLTLKRFGMLNDESTTNVREFANVEDEKLHEALVDVANSFQDMDTVLSLTLFLRSNNPRLNFALHLAFQMVSQEVASSIGVGNLDPPRSSPLRVLGLAANFSATTPACHEEPLGGYGSVAA